MKRSRAVANTSLGLMLVYLAIIIAIGVGWIINIVELAEMSGILESGEGILRVAGIFLPPLGAIMGLFF